MIYNEHTIKKLLDKGVSERELNVVLDRARGLTLREIAEDEGVTPERVRMIEARGINKISKILKPKVYPALINPYI